ncbi:hypothetical protein [Komagataeibacter swingsii]|uniref:hypothetical protein n=1 Tax=Komagataeibacter swingsii TaxID=215220 RepID=UPI0034E522C6
MPPPSIGMHQKPSKCDRRMTSSDASCARFCQTPWMPRAIWLGGLIRTIFGAVGKAFSKTPRGDAEITAYADAMADMFEAYLIRLAEES